MIKPGRIGRPPNQPTNHTIYGRWEGAQVLLLVLRGLPDLPFLGGRSLPTSFSAHLTILSATQRCTPLPWHAFGGQTHRHSCFSRAFPSLLTRFQHGTALLGRNDPRAQDFKACDAFSSHLELSSRVRSRISQGDCQLHGGYSRENFPGGRSPADNQPTSSVSPRAISNAP
jgi:hypothetical protein